MDNQNTNIDYESIHNKMIEDYKFLFDELYVFNSYNYKDGELKGKIVIDIGANTGYFAILAVEKGAKKVYAFEPNRENFIKLVNRTKDFENIIPINKAVYSPGIKKCYTVYEDARCEVRTDGKQEGKIDCISLKEILDNIDESVILKTDSEGSEYDFILPCSRETLRKIEIIYSEFHNNLHSNPKYNSDMLTDFIVSNGFENIKYKPTWETGTWVDGAFIPNREIGENGTSNCYRKFVRKEENINESLIELRLNFLKRILMGVLPNDIHTNFISTTHYPSEEVMRKCIVMDFNELFVEGLTWPDARAYTMIGLKRLDNLHSSMDYVRKNNVPGDFIETGVWKGGACLFMKAYINMYNLDKKLFVADSFEGCPLPNIIKYPEDANDDHYTKDPIKVSFDEVRDNFIRFGLLDDNVIFIKGWFENSLKNIDIYELSILRFDGDLYGSTIDVLEALYSKVVENGIVIIDDYGLDNCKKATDYFRSKYQINDLLHRIDNYGIFWYKNSEATRPKVYDCFPFFNEFELLKIRLSELYKIVDKFIITEATQTHSGKPKPLYLQENINIFDEYKDKIIIHTVDFDPTFTDPWQRERMQRDAALDVLKNIVTDKDYIIISDCDEIPREESIRFHIEKGTLDVGILVQDRFSFYLNNKNITTDEPQLNSRIVSCKILCDKNITPCAIRYCDNSAKHLLIPYYDIPNSGWHFTFMGGVDKVIEKIQSFAHQEYNTPEKINTDRILDIMNSGKDIYSCNSTWKNVNIDETFPKLVQKNKKEYTSMGWIKEESKTYKIYDCFLFFNELDILDIRLNELNDVVDKFVLVEARYTHQGKEKPLYFEENKSRYTKFLDKIIHLVIDKFPISDESYKQAWDNENYQRNFILNGLMNCADDDLIIISDCDEIPRASTIKRYDSIRSFDQKLYYYNFNSLSESNWEKAKILSYKELKEWVFPNNLRNLKCETIKDGGWHFSYFADTDGISEKLKAFSHVEYKDIPKDRISKCINENIDLFAGFRNIKMQRVNVDETYPKYVVDNKQYFSDKGFIILDIHDKMKNIDSFVYHEIYDINIYDISEQEIKNKIVVDIGANVGIFAIKCVELGAKQVLCFEPQKNNFNTLLDFTKAFENIKSYNFAILDGSVNEVCINDGKAGSSIFFETKDPPSKCISLEEAIHDIHEEDLILKIDCEGCEFEIILNTPNNILKKFEYIHIEIHDQLNPKYIGKSKELISHIESLGFSIASIGPQAGVWQTDGSFIASEVYCYKFKRV